MSKRQDAICGALGNLIGSGIWLAMLLSGRYSLPVLVGITIAAIGVALYSLGKAVS